MNKENIKRSLVELSEKSVKHEFKTHIDFDLFFRENEVLLFKVLNDQSKLINPDGTVLGLLNSYLIYEWKQGDKLLEKSDFIKFIIESCFRILETFNYPVPKT